MPIKSCPLCGNKAFIPEGEKECISCFIDSITKSSLEKKQEKKKKNKKGGKRKMTKEGLIRELIKEPMVTRTEIAERLIKPEKNVEEEKNKQTGKKNNTENKKSLRHCKKCSKFGRIYAEGLCWSCYKEKYDLQKGKCKNCGKTRMLIKNRLCRTCYNAIKKHSSFLSGFPSSEKDSRVEDQTVKENKLCLEQQVEGKSIKKDASTQILIDFSSYPEILEMLQNEAKKAFRTVELQILYCLFSFFGKVGKGP